jgi:hypothetical protein
MTKLTKSVRSTIREVVEKHCVAGSAEVRVLTASVVRDLLREEHGIRVRLASLIRFAERVA